MAHLNKDMDFEKFLTNQGSDFKGRTLDEIWSYSDNEIEGIHDFIQIVFPTTNQVKLLSTNFIWTMKY